MAVNLRNNIHHFFYLYAWLLILGVFVAVSNSVFSSLSTLNHHTFIIMIFKSIFFMRISSYQSVFHNILKVWQVESQHWFRKWLCTEWMTSHMPLSETMMTHRDSSPESISLIMKFCSRAWIQWKKNPENYGAKKCFIYKDIIVDSFKIQQTMTQKRNLYQQHQARTALNQSINALRPSDAIWRQGSGSTLAQVMACCLMAPSHHPNQCWLITSKVFQHSSEANFQRDNSAINHLIWLPKFLIKNSLQISWSLVTQTCASEMVYFWLNLEDSKQLPNLILSYCQMDP